MEINPDYNIIDGAKMEHGLFKCKTANDYVNEAKNKPIPKLLFDQFWCEGEVCILFSSTNVGKSILAVQIADAISSGRPIGGIEINAVPQKVLYFDFEMTPKQFERRCCESESEEQWVNHYLFDDRFFRIEMETANDESEGGDFNEYLRQQMESVILESGAKVIIIDNITWLAGGTEKEHDAMPLMKWCYKFFKGNGLSALCLAHTPKRPKYHPILVTDLKGSSDLSNFCDSCFTIGVSTKGKNVRYLKQLKVRNNEYAYDAEHVMTFELCKTNPSNFVHFSHTGFSYESEHLKCLDDVERAGLVDQAKDMKKQGKSQRDIASSLGVSVGTINNYLKS